MAMGKLSAAQIRALTKPGRYIDGDGLSLLLTAPVPRQHPWHRFEVVI